MTPKLSTEKKREILHKLCVRQDWRCFWCGELMNAEMSSAHYRTLEHVIPVSKGRETGDLANLRAACRECNEIRGAFNSTGEAMKRINHLLKMIEDRDKSLDRHKITMAGRCYFCKFKFHFKEWLHGRKRAA